MVIVALLLPSVDTPTLIINILKGSAWTCKGSNLDVGACIKGLLLFILITKIHRNSLRQKD